MVTLCTYCAPGSAETRKTDRKRLNEIFNRELGKLLESENGTDVETREYLEGFRIEHDPSRLYLHIGPGTKRRPSSVAETELVRKFQNLQRHYAKELHDFARSEIASGSFASAYRLLNAVAFHDSGHPVAKLLAPSFTSQKIVARKGRSPHRQIGWKKGEYWIIQSSEFQIATNADRQQGIELATQLAILKQAWRQTFFEYWCSGDVFKASISRKKQLHRLGPKHRVILFANRHDYVTHLAKIEPLARMTLGYYSSTDKTSFFFVDDGTSSGSTWLHEATHQLFQESKKVRADVGRRSDFWVIEALALYMESLQPVGHYWSVGGLEADRLQFARFRRLVEKYDVSVGEFARLGQNDLQNHADIRKLYSQAAGLAHFFLDPREPNRRRAFLRYVNGVYSGRPAFSALIEHLEKKSKSVDQAYFNFLAVEDQDLLTFDSRVQPRNLALGNCSISDKGLKKLDLSQLHWLDLSNTKVTDDGLSSLNDATRLTQLSLENTEVTDRTVRLLHGHSQVEQLDLSGTNVTDDSMDVLASLPALKQLWIDRTRISAPQRNRLQARLRE